jgi:hypothetical protein
MTSTDRNDGVVVLEIMRVVPEKVDQAMTEGISKHFGEGRNETYSSPTLSKFAELHSFRNVSVSSKNQTSRPSIVVSSCCPVRYSRTREVQRNYLRHGPQRCYTLQIRQDWWVLDMDQEEDDHQGETI